MTGSRISMAVLAIVSTASAVVVAILIANSSLQPIWIVGIPIIFSSTTGAAVARLTAPAIMDPATDGMCQVRKTNTREPPIT